MTFIFHSTAGLGKITVGVSGLYGQGCSEVIEALRDNCAPDPLRGGMRWSVHKHFCHPSCECTPNDVIHQKPLFDIHANGDVDIVQQHARGIYASNMLQADYKLRWLNILRKIHAEDISFNPFGFYLCLVGISSQTGPRGSSGSHLLETHEILHDVDFCSQMLDVLESSLAGLKQGWLSQLSLLISLGPRVLALSNNSRISETMSCYLYGLAPE